MNLVSFFVEKEKTISVQDTLNKRFLHGLKGRF